MKKDKIQHSIVCCALVIIGARLNILIGVAIALLFAFGKEVWDGKQPANKFDWGDIMADSAGIIMGILLA